MKIPIFFNTFVNPFKEVIIIISIIIIIIIQPNFNSEVFFKLSRISTLIKMLLPVLFLHLLTGIPVFLKGEALQTSSTPHFDILCRTELVQTQPCSTLKKNKTASNAQTIPTHANIFQKRISYNNRKYKSLFPSKPMKRLLTPIPMEGLLLLLKNPSPRWQLEFQLVEDEQSIFASLFSTPLIIRECCVHQMFV